MKYFDSTSPESTVNFDGRDHGRVAPRFRIGVPVELEDGIGQTRDLCTTGVFFTATHTYTPGAQVEFTIVLDEMNANKPLRMRCSGEVVRIEELGGEFGVAAKISEYTIQT